MLLPAMGMMVTAGIAGAQDTVPALSGGGTEASAAGNPTAVSLRGQPPRDGPPGDHLPRPRRAGRQPPGRACGSAPQGPRSHARRRRLQGALARPACGRLLGARARRRRAPSARSRVRVNVYRPAEASYYGPGLYGGALACGGTLSPGKLGVANKTLPCGASGHAPLPRPHGHRPGDRPRPLRGQSRVRPHGRDQGEARLPLHGDRADHPLDDATEHVRRAGRAGGALQRSPARPRRHRQGARASADRSARAARAPCPRRSPARRCGTGGVRERV